MSKNMVEKVETVNFLRGMAIVAVVYHHVFSVLTPPGIFAVTLGPVSLFPLTFLSNGWLGVSFFFVMSGFVLYLPYANGKRDLKKPGSLRFFLIRRSLRILPLFYISIGVAWVFMSRGVSPARFLRELVLVITMTFHFTADMWIPRANAFMWAIGPIFWFSVLFPLVLYGFRRFSPLGVFIFVSIFSLIVRFLGTMSFVPVSSHMLNFVRDSVFGRMDDFVLGMLICSWFTGSGKKDLKILRPAMLLPGILILFAACTTWDHVRLSNISISAGPFLNMAIQAAIFLIFAGMSAILDTPSTSGLLGKIAGLISCAGAASYSIYAWQIPVMCRTVAAEFIWYQRIRFVIILALVSAASYILIEVGFTGFLQKKLAKKT